MTTSAPAGVASAMVTTTSNSRQPLRATPTVAAGQPQQQRTRSRPFYDNVPSSISRERQDAINQHRRVRPAFAMTPGDREASRLSKSGRQLSELEILQEKHEPEFRQVVPIVADALTAVVQQHGILARTAAKEDRFAHYETNTVPGILVEDYVQRIAEYTYISPTTLVVSLIFLDRLSDRYPQLLITQLNIFKLFFVATRVGSKVNDLRTLNNKHFASVGGISNKHLNELEARFLIDLRFDLFVSPREFQQYAQRIAPQQPAVHRALAATGASSSGQGNAVVRIRQQTTASRESSTLVSSLGDDDHPGGEHVTSATASDGGASKHSAVSDAPHVISGNGASS